MITSNGKSIPRGLLNTTKWVATGKLTQNNLTQTRDLFIKYGNEVAKGVCVFFEPEE